MCTGVRILPRTECRLAPTCLASPLAESSMRVLSPLIRRWGLGSWKHDWAQEECHLLPPSPSNCFAPLCVLTPLWTFYFSSLAIIQNIKADPHLDKNNLASTLNAVFPLTAFWQGGIWCESDDGQEVQVLNGKEVHTGFFASFQKRLARYRRKLGSVLDVACLLTTFVIRATANRSFIAWCGRLSAVNFDMCTHGGSRDKRTRFLTSASELGLLACDCDGLHEHKSWSAQTIASI